MADWIPPGDHRFTRDRRLLTKKHYDGVFQGGRKVGRPSIVVFILTRPPEPGAQPRLGRAVSRKVGNAVVRNGVRRRLREAFRLALPQFLVPADIVVVARPQAAKDSFAELQSQLLSALRRAAVLPGE